MRRRGLLAVGLSGVASSAGALTPCMPGTRPAVMAHIRFGLLLPNGDEVTETQWQVFRGDILDPVLRAPLRVADEPPPQRARTAAMEVSVSFNPDAPPDLPPSVRTVMRAWSARFPTAPVEARMVPICARS